MANRDDVQEANPDTSVSFDDLRLGPPFAMSDDCELVEGQCSAVVQCTCGAAIRLQLLVAGVKHCPQCKAGYTHVLLVCAADNDELCEAALEHIFQANGIELPDEDDAAGGEDGERAEVVDGADDDSEGR